MNFIDRIKEKLKERENKALVREASTLKDLRRERIRLEGIKKVKDLRSKEQSRIKSVKKDLFNRSTGGRVVGFLQKRAEEFQKQARKKQTINKPRSNQSRTVIIVQQPREQTTPREENKTNKGFKFRL